MKLTYTSLKKLINNSQSVSISDSLPLNLIMRLATEVGREGKHMTIRVKKLGIEDLAKISEQAKFQTTFIVEEVQED